MDMEIYDKVQLSESGKNWVRGLNKTIGIIVGIQELTCNPEHSRYLYHVEWNNGCLCFHMASDLDMIAKCKSYSFKTSIEWEEV